ncbi:MAG: hypothetical protein WC455_27935 [Dehalococcoidia bacterium]|jgi:hypothetical protein
MREAPTVEEVKDLYAANLMGFGSLYAAFDEDETYYELAFAGELNLPVEYKDLAVVLPSARNSIDTFADWIGIDNAKVQVSRRKQNKAEEESAEQLRRFGSGLVYMTNVNAAISPWRVAAKHYPLYGVAWLKTVYNADLWPDKPIQKKGESDETYKLRESEWENVCEGTLPISISAINPRCIMFDTGTTGQTWVIEHYKKPVEDVIRHWKKWKPEKGYDGGEEVLVIDYWDKDYRCVIVDGIAVLNTKSGVAKHGYGFVPYVCIDAGLGNITSDNDLSMRFVGMNRKIQPVLKSESRDYSLQDIVISKNGMPAVVLSGDNAVLVQKFDLSFGEVNKLPEGVKFEQVQPMMPPSEITQHYYTTREIIDGSTIPRSMRGQSETNVRSGSDRRQLMAAGQTRLKYPEMAFKNRSANVLNNCARLLKKIPGNVTVFSHTPSDEFYDVIDKNKIREPINFHIKFNPTDPEEEFRLHDDLIRLKHEALLTKRSARKKMHDVNVDEEERQELKEMIFMSPAIQNGIQQLIGVMTQAAIQGRMAAEGLPGPTVPPSAGQPPTGSPTPPPGGMVTQNRQVAPLGSAQALQNQMNQNRSQTAMNPTQGRSAFAGGSQNSWQR